MTITQLEYAIAVDTYRSFAEAAKSCYVTQPTLSMQIKKLEEELHILIFDRTKKPVLTTEIGKLVVDQARITVLEAARIKELIQNRKDEIKGELKIGIIPTLSPYLLPLFITKFMADYPEVTLQIEELTSQQILNKLQNDLLDVAIMVTPMHIQGLIERPVFYEKFVVFLSTDHQLTRKQRILLSDLNLQDIWLLKEGHCFRSQVINLCQENNKLPHNRLLFESGSLETLRRIVEKQFGYTLLPELAVLDLSAEQKNLHIRPFTDPQPVREVSLVLRRNFMKRKLIDLLHRSISENLPSHIDKEKSGKVMEWTT